MIETMIYMKQLSLQGVKLNMLLVRTLILKLTTLCTVSKLHLSIVGQAQSNKNSLSLLPA